jgi:branched-chain amino acid transport system substrate-binding protein
MNLKRPLKVAVAVCLILILATMSLLSGGCAAGGSKVKVGFSICYTGPAAEKGRPLGDGKLDCMKYINEELDGVAGHQVEAIWRDNGYDAAKAATVINELISKDCLFFTTNSSKMMGASMEIANRAKFPGFSVFSSPVLIHPPQHIYGQMPDYGDDWAAFAEYYLKNIWKGTGKPRMALHLLNNPTGSGARDAARALADEQV